MSEVKKCPKCSREMVKAHRLVAHTKLLASVSLAKEGALVGERIIPFYCVNCGYIEFYKEMRDGKDLYEHSFPRKCIKCSKQIPIASEECQYCGAEQKGVKS
jgi:predicted nucleic-acid-binding Zn-ribbon protein